MRIIASLAAVSAGASCGASARWLIGLLLNGIGGLPLGTTFVNVSGGFLIGVLSPLLDSLPNAAPELRLTVITGFLGGLTTFSTFSLEAASMLRDGRYAVFALHFLMNAAGSICAVLLGLWLYGKIRG